MLLHQVITTMPEYERIRTCTPDILLSMYQRAAETNKYIATAAPVKQDRVELIHYIKEQSISYEYHRYGSGQVQEPAIE